MIRENIVIHFKMQRIIHAQILCAVSVFNEVIPVIILPTSETIHEKG